MMIAHGLRNRTQGEFMTGTTGHRCPRSGIWQGSDACRTRIALSKDDVFPPCSGCRRAVTWVLVTPT
jgi:hypothetical protein